MMALLSHFKPKRIRMIPTARRKSLIGTHLTSATPSVATITASVAAAANAPSSELRQLIVTPTTSTMVNASTNSTAEARNAAVAIAHCMQLFSYSDVEWPRHDPLARVHSHFLPNCNTWPGLLADSQCSYFRCA